MTTLFNRPTLKWHALLQVAIACFLFIGLPRSVIADEGQPVAIRYWPGNGVSIETMWNFHIAIGLDSENRNTLPRVADVEFVDDFWEAAGSNSLILDRQPNDTQVALKPASESLNPSTNSVHFSRVVLNGDSNKKSLSLNIIAVDGVVMVDSNKHSVADLITVLQDVKELPRSLSSIDVVLIHDTNADQAAFQTLQGLLKARAMILREAVKFDEVGEIPVERIAHNTFAISKSAENSGVRWIKLAETPWTMDKTLEGLFAKKEAACRSSRELFAALSSNQMNFKPGDGTHTPRWNAEHMMGRELLFFSQIFHAVDANIPIMDLNPKQMPVDYQASHADWTGLEESLQMERVEAFTRRFAYLLDGMDINKKAKGSAFWTPRSLLKQMETHYREHTANVVKKKDLPGWPKE